MKKRVIIAAALYLWNICCFVGGFAEENAEDRIVLYEQPSDQALPIADYYVGTSIKVIDESSLPWVPVEISFLSERGNATGYIRQEQLANENVLHGVPIGIIQTNGKGAELHDAPDVSAPIIGKYLDGTRVCIWGEWKNGWLHVAFGNTTGFVQKKWILMTEGSSMYGTSYAPPAIGYLISNVRSNKADANKQFVFPSASSEIVSPSSFSSKLHSGYVHTLVGELSDWYQIGSSLNAYCGFVQKENYDAYLLNDLLIDKVFTVEKGTYQVGRDIPSGLYTFTPPGNTIGQVSVSGTNTNLDRDFSIAGPCTFYAPSDSMVKVLSDGSLSPMKHELLVTEDRPFTGNGRFLLGVQIPSDLHHIVLKSLVGEAPCYYRLDNMNGIAPESYIPGDEVHEIAFPGTLLQEGESINLSHLDGMFLEIQNVELALKIPLG